MKNNAWRNAQADDLWKVLSTVADFDVPVTMKTYLEEPSHAFIEFAENSENSEISQSRYFEKSPDEFC